MGLLDNTTQQAYYSGNDHGNYQFVSLHDIIEQFMFVYVGEDKIIPKASRTDVAFHAQRALAELSFDTFKSFKGQEITVPATLQMTLPHDYVNYTKLSWVDSAGIKHLMYPTSKTSNPSSSQMYSDGDFLFDQSGNIIPSGNLVTNGDFHGSSDGWALNEINWSTTSTPEVQTPEVESVTVATLGDPIKGYFYGFDGNAIGAYTVPQYWGIRQDNIPIISGEEYKITYTLSGYTSGEWAWYIVDKNGDATLTTARTANGTYTETITATSTETYDYTANSVFSIVRVGSENLNTTWENYKSGTPSENQDDYQDDTYWPMDGSRFGLDPSHAQANGSFYIDQVSGKIHFSSNVSGKTVILDYISDSLGTDGEMQVHKFAEEAMYKWISHAILAGKSNIPEYQVNRFKKERFAAIRTAKLRLSNIKLEEITQILRGKSKQIKH
jgi:hypothetical protein